MNKTTLIIKGMACGMCEAHINDCIRQNFNIKKITTSHKKGNSVIISDTPPNGNKLNELISDLGYSIVSYHTEEYSKKGLFGK